MEPYGDPEARIRDLERPLADRAQASELGAQPYEGAPPPPPPPPPPPGAAPHYAPPPPPSDPYQGQQYGQYSSQYGTPQYTSPYYAAPQRVVRKRSRTTALWLLPLLFAAVLIGGVVTIVMHVNSAIPDFDTFDPSPPISGGGATLDTPGPPTAESPIVPEKQIITVEPGGSVSVGGVDKNETIVCNGGTVGISGGENTIEVQGNCASVSVSGVENNVTVETSASISVSGVNNRVTYRTGTPEISNSGFDNVVEQG